MVDKTLIPEEFYDVALVLEMGAKKYGKDAWLHGISMSHRSNHESMSRHLAEAYCHKDIDHESGLDPLLHLATRALMEYTMKQRGLSKLLLDEKESTKLKEYIDSKPLPNKELRKALRDSAEFLMRIQASDIPFESEVPDELVDNSMIRSALRAAGKKFDFDPNEET